MSYFLAQMEEKSPDSCGLVFVSSAKRLKEAWAMLYKNKPQEEDL